MTLQASRSSEARSSALPGYLSLAIETQGLTKRYGEVVAVDNLSLRVKTGGVFGLLGPNGSGKTTTISMLLGLVAPSSGTVSLFGEPFTRQALRRVGAVVEAPSFYPYMSGRDNLRYFQGIGDRNSAANAANVEEVLRITELSARADSAYKTYSLGMKQRLGIAYALLGDPELLFLDEPTNGLDPAGVVEIRELIKSIGQSGKTVVLSSHLLHEVEQVCDDVTIIAKGKKIIEGRVSELLSKRSEVRLKTTDDANALRVLGALDGVKAVGQSNGYLVVQAATEMAGELTKALAAHETYITEMQPVQDTLERFFLQVTGEEGLAASEVPR
jgi:ABC-2 type transport system ATP-binding protein